MVVPAEGVVELGGRGALQALEHSHISLGGNVAANRSTCAFHPAVAYDRYNARPSLTPRCSCGPAGTY